MPRDYKSRANPPRKKQKQAPGWTWFLGGLLTGLFIAGLAWLKFPPQGQMAASVPAKQASVPKKSSRKTEKRKEPRVPKPRFDFYTILPEMEIVVPEPRPEPEPTPVRAAGAPAPVVTAGRNGEPYMLQMGSFRKYSDADRLKASLALVGIEAEIQRVSIDSGETYHRVRSGPYQRRQVNQLRARLKENRINSLVIKLKK
jgi:cell division protein FtsN